jgi:energy-converting hydrogenase Eha subunit H
MPQLIQTSRAFRNTQVIVRFALRMVILCVFATLGSIGFARSFNALLWMSATVSVAVGIVRRESAFDSALTYWDEAAAYGLLCCLAAQLAQAPAP